VPYVFISLIFLPAHWGSIFSIIAAIEFPSNGHPGKYKGWLPNKSIFQQAGLRGGKFIWGYR
jgi:hypothetical protein